MVHAASQATQSLHVSYGPSPSRFKIFLFLLRAVLTGFSNFFTTNTAEDTPELAKLRLQPRRCPGPAQTPQKTPRYKEPSSSVDDKDVDTKGTISLNAICISNLHFNFTSQIYISNLHFKFTFQTHIYLKFTIHLFHLPVLPSHHPSSPCSEATEEEEATRHKKSHRPKQPCLQASRRPRPTPWSFLTFFSSCLSTSTPPGGAWRADFKSIYGRNFGVRLLTQIVFLLL
jgi:hypothetical protein